MYPKRLPRRTARTSVVWHIQPDILHFHPHHHLTSVLLSSENWILSLIDGQWIVQSVISLLNRALRSFLMSRWGVWPINSMRQGLSTTQNHSNLYLWRKTMTMWPSRRVQTAAEDTPVQGPRHFVTFCLRAPFRNHLINLLLVRINYVH